MLRFAIIASVGLVAQVAAADPATDRVVAAPTAWLPTAGTVVASVGVDSHAKALAELAYGLGGIAEVEVGADSDVRQCSIASCSGSPAPESYLARAQFRVGARQNAWFEGQPALVLGVRATIGSELRAADAYVVASRRLGPATLHAGLGELRALDAGIKSAPIVRPSFGLEIVPPPYPKSSLIADLAWMPELELGKPTSEYVFDWGVRYQTFPWGTVELAVRHREAEFGSPTVMVRFTAVLSP